MSPPFPLFVNGKKHAQHGRPPEEFVSFKAAHSLVAGAILVAGCSLCMGQEVIHAVTGVATKVDNDAHTITLTTSDGDEMIVRDEAANHPGYDFDKALRAETVESTAFNKQGDRVILYYFGEGWQRRAVAVKDLGPAPLKLTTGQITHWDRHHHVVTVKAANGSTETFQLDGKTAVDTPMGVVNGDKFDAHNGDQISIKYLDNNGSNEAVFLSES
jgi:hypothetical protein